jgi:hypothetical protein
LKRERNSLGWGKTYKKMGDENGRGREEESERSRERTRSKIDSKEL